MISETCFPVITITKTTSDALPSSEIELAIDPPSFLSRSRRSVLKSNPQTSKPALIKFCAMGNPISPSPINPIRFTGRFSGIKKR